MWVMGMGVSDSLPETKFRRILVYQISAKCQNAESEFRDTLVTGTGQGDWTSGDFSFWHSFFFASSAIWFRFDSFTRFELAHL